MARVVILPERDLAWAAGFFDGEGAVTVSTIRAAYGTYYYPNVQIGQKHPKVLYWFQKHWGGSVSAHRQKGTGNADQGRVYTTSHWMVATAQCRNFLADIQPYVRCKRTQVDYVLSRPRLSLTKEEREVLSSMKGEDLWPELSY